jgi:hypothetical protein
VLDISLLVCEYTDITFSWHKVMAPGGRDRPIVLMFNLQTGQHYQELVWDGRAVFENVGALPAFLQERFNVPKSFPTLLDA